MTHLQEARPGFRDAGLWAKAGYGSTFPSRGRRRRRRRADRNNSPKSERRAPTREPASHTATFGSPNRSVYEPRKPLGMCGGCPGCHDALRGDPGSEPRHLPWPSTPTAATDDRQRPSVPRWRPARCRPARSDASDSWKSRSSAPHRSRASTLAAGPWSIGPASDPRSAGDSFGTARDFPLTDGACLRLAARSRRAPWARQFQVAGVVSIYFR